MNGGNMEKVLVIKKNDLQHLIGNGNYNLYMEKKNIFLTIARNSNMFIPRNIAEEDTDYKQVIPYAFLTFQDNVFLLKRLPKQNEKRLHHKVSIGVGGHINPVEKPIYDDMIKEGLFREVNEEIDLSLNNIISVDFIGVINDDTTNVGKVHLGFVYHIKLENQNLEVLEKDKMEGFWIHKKDINKYIDNMETWSKIIIESITI
jgi:predicted NUDIX family phosphoesterase